MTLTQTIITNIEAAEAEGRQPVGLPDIRQGWERTLDHVIPVVDRVEAATTPTPEGHLRPLHWVFLGAFLWFLAWAIAFIGQVDEHFALGLSLVAGWCLLHAGASWAKQSGEGEQ